MPFLSIQVLTEGGTTIPAPGDYFVEPGSTHTIKAVAYEGYEFAGFIVIGGPQHGGHSENPISVTVPDDVTVLVYVLFNPKPKPIPVKPPDFILVRYEWRPFEGGVFPFTLDDVRKAWTFVYTVKNVGGKIGEFELLIYLENAPPYIPSLMYHRIQPNVDAGQELTLEDVVLPETKGEEYYVLKLVSLETNVARVYTIGKTPEAPEPTPPTPPAPPVAPAPTPTPTPTVEVTPPAPTTIAEEVKKAAPLLGLAALIGLALLSRRR